MLAVSVIIPCYERTDYLERAVRSALEQDFDPVSYEVIVVDSSSSSTNRELLERMIPLARCRLRYLHKSPEGPGPSRNLGAREAEAQILAFLDSDCDATPAWLGAGLRAFSEGIGLVQGRVVPDPATPPHVFNACIDIPHETFIYEAANIFYRRAAFEQAGGFPADLNPDSHLIMGGEDTDLAWAVKRNGWKSVFASDALVVHPVIRMNTRQWIFPRRVAIFPRCTRNNPEIRRFMYRRYFFDRAQAYLLLALAGVAGSALSLWFLLLTAPYLVLRGGKGSRTLRGPLRILRVLLYLPRDTGTLLILIANSFRFGALLL